MSILDAKHWRDKYYELRKQIIMLSIDLEERESPSASLLRDELEEILKKT